MSIFEQMRDRVFQMWGLPGGGTQGQGQPNRMEDARLMREGTPEERMAALQRMRGYTGGGMRGGNGPFAGIASLLQNHAGGVFANRLQPPAGTQPPVTPQIGQQPQNGQMAPRTGITSLMQGFSKPR